MIYGCAGQEETGKTYTLKSMVAREVRRRQGWRFLVLDVNSEWPGEPGRDLVSVARTVRDPSSARAALEVTPLVLMRPDVLDTDYRTIGDELARAAIAGPPTVLVLPEAHEVCPEGKDLPTHVKTIRHRWRHTDVSAGLWWDSHNFRDVSKALLNGTRFLYLFATGSLEDIDRIRRLGGPELVDAVKQCGDLDARGEKGWHVQVRPTAVRPPFQLRRV